MNGIMITTPRSALLLLRATWFGMMIGQIAALIVIVLLFDQGTLPADRATALITCGAFLLLIVLTVLGYFIRGQVYKANWVGDVITPRGYVNGNLVFLAMLESNVFVGLGATVHEDAFGLPLIPAVLAMAIQIINYPNGRAMYPPDHLMGG